MDKKTSENKGTFYDTPGLADPDHSQRSVAAKAIRDALREGGEFKILFFVLTEAGRVVTQDVAAMKLVLDAAPELGNRYGIVINQLPHRVSQMLQNETSLHHFLSQLFSGIEESRVCARSNIMKLPKLKQLDGKNNILIDLNLLEDACGKKFSDFVYNEVPTVHLTKHKAKDIAVQSFESTLTRLEETPKNLASKISPNSKSLFVSPLHRALEQKERKLYRNCI